MLYQVQLRAAAEGPLPSGLQALVPSEAPQTLPCFPHLQVTLFPFIPGTTVSHRMWQSNGDSA